MKILILGYSDFVKRRILPILEKKFKNFSIGICSRSTKKPKLNFTWFRNYEESIKIFKPDIVYISLPNSMHFKYGMLALKNNANVIIDKPITLSLIELKLLVRLAIKKRKLIAEAIIFNYHNQFSKALEILKTKKNIQMIISNFTIPIPDKNNIKMSSILGGGVNNDMGPYLAALIRIFFNDINFSLNVNYKKKSVVENLTCLVSKKNVSLFFHTSLLEMSTPIN